MTESNVPDEGYPVDETIGEVDWLQGYNGDGSEVTRYTYVAAKAIRRIRETEVAKLEQQAYVSKTWADETMRRMMLFEQQRDAVRAQLAELVEAGGKLQVALKQYEMDVDEAPPFRHKQMMGNWDFAIAKINQSEEEQP